MDEIVFLDGTFDILLGNKMKAICFNGVKQMKVSLNYR